MLGPFFLRFQRDAMALTLAGDQADFTAVARQALNTETKQAMSSRDIDHVLEGFAKVSAFPDALPALQKLADSGVKVGCLTVGDPDNTRSFLAAAGLDSYVDEVVTSSAVGTWKPAPAVYHYSAQSLGCELDRMALVAVHAWDCHGANRVGALAGWCSAWRVSPATSSNPPTYAATTSWRSSTDSSHSEPPRYCHLCRRRVMPSDVRSCLEVAVACSARRRPRTDSQSCGAPPSETVQGGPASDSSPRSSRVRCGCARAMSRPGG